MITLPMNGKLDIDQAAFVAAGMELDTAAKVREFVASPEKAIGEWLSDSWNGECVPRFGQDMDGRDIFAGLLHLVFQAWRKTGMMILPDAENGGEIVRYSEALLGKAGRFADELSRIFARKVGTWDRMIWAFPDQIIAQAMGVTRQAAAARRRKAAERMEGDLDPVERYMAAREVREGMVASALGIGMSAARAIFDANVATLRCSLEHFPDLEPADSEKRRAAIMEHDRNADGVPDAIEWLMIFKGFDALESARMIMAVCPDLIAGRDAAIDARVGFVTGTTAMLRERCGDWRERFSMIPDKRECAPDLDPVDGLAASKGVSPEEAARLLWAVYGRDIEREERLRAMESRGSVRSGVVAG